MSPQRAPRTATAKRVPYRAPRRRREVWTAVAVAVLIVVATSTLVWFLRPNRESTAPISNPEPSFSTIPTTLPVDTTPTTAPAETTPPTESTAAASGG